MKAGENASCVGLVPAAAILMFLLSKKSSPLPRSLP
jgi:hypothetical protein